MTKHAFLYSVYHAMKQRCFNPKCKIFPHYGARGITVCDEWSAPNGVYAFTDWAIAAGWQEGLTLDRINNDGNYEPSNCRFVTRAENLRNRRMTPAWRAAIDRMLSFSHKRRHTMTPKKLAACRANMAKARAVAFTLPHSQAQIDAAIRNLPAAWASMSRQRSSCPATASQPSDHHNTPLLTL